MIDANVRRPSERYSKGDMGFVLTLEFLLVVVVGAVLVVLDVADAAVLAPEVV